MSRRSFASLVVLAVIATACSSDETSSTSSSVASSSTPTDAIETSAATEPVSEAPSTAVATTGPTTTGVQTTDVTTTAAPTTNEPDPSSARGLVEVLASDALTGRDNGTAGSNSAREVLVEQVSQFAMPAYPDRSGAEGYLQHFDTGTNVIGMIPGSDLAGEFVVIGGHYDHLGSDCPTSDPSDTVCNGATDNATGAAAAVAVARVIAADGVPRRSVIVALWDAEEDGLVGSSAFLANPVVPLGQMVGYINFDIQGATMLPSLADVTFAIGAETGGPNMVAATQAATQSSTLNAMMLSLVFGQGRSDHATFVAAGVPSVFFTDATSGCYHTSQDDLNAVDFDKLDQQIATALTLARDLVATNDAPELDTAAPASTYDDAVAILEVGELGEADFTQFDAAGQAAGAELLVSVRAVVAAGPERFDAASVGTLLGAAAMFVAALERSTCERLAG